MKPVMIALGMLGWATQAEAETPFAVYQPQGGEAIVFTSAEVLGAEPQEMLGDSAKRAIVVRLSEPALLRFRAMTEANVGAKLDFRLCDRTISSGVTLLSPMPLAMVAGVTLEDSEWALEVLNGRQPCDAGS